MRTSGRPRRRLWPIGPLLALGVAATAVSSSAAARPEAPARAKALPAGPAVLAGASRCAANRAAGTIIFVSPFSYDASVGILDVLEAERLGYFAALCLKVEFVGSSGAPLELVSAGRATFTGEGSAADLLQETASGADLVGVATFGDVSDYAILTRPSIRSLRQLAGKTLAYHPPLPVALSEMLAAAGVGVSRVHLVTDPSYDPLLLTEGKFDALQAYRSNEPITLRAAHQAFREFVPSDYGVKGTFNVQVVNGGFLRRHPGAVADFLRAELHAFDYCAVHAAACVDGEAAAASAAGVDYEKAHNLAEWRFEVGLAGHSHLPGRGVGVETAAEWRPEAAALLRDHLVSRQPDLAKVEDTALAASLYSGTALRWPGS